MSNLLRFALVLLPLAACVSPAADDGADTDVDDAVSDQDAGKADQVQALKHYVMFARDGKHYVTRSNGGTMRCFDNTLAEQCAIDVDNVVAPGGLGGSAAVMLDELDDQPLMVNARLVRAANDVVYLRVASSMFALTSVVPPVGPDHPDTETPASCYLLHQMPNVDIKYTRLDGSKVTTASVSEFDGVDPTPDFWGQPTPAVEAKIDAALEQSKTHTVFACGYIEFRTDVHQYWFSANQVFANL